MFAPKYAPVFFCPEAAVISAAPAPPRPSHTDRNVSRLLIDDNIGLESSPFLTFFSVKIVNPISPLKSLSSFIKD